MGWPQIFVASLFAFGFIYSLVKYLRDKDASSARVTFNVFFLAALDTLYVYALHVGGFW